MSAIFVSVPLIVSSFHRRRSWSSSRWSERTAASITPACSAARSSQETGAEHVSPLVLVQVPTGQVRSCVSVLRSSLLNHMAREHSFSVGLPDNIVFCKLFLETLQSKLDRWVSRSPR